MENFDFDTEEFEMPTPCEHCGEIFDLNDGYGSAKWHPNITICEKCHEDEEAEIEEDERWEGINDELSNALYIPHSEEGAWAKLSKENQALMIHIVSQQSGLLTAFLEYGKQRHYTPLTSEQIEALVNDFKGSL